MNAKILAAALALLVAGGAVADASAAVVTKTTKTVAHSTIKPAVVKKVTLVRRAYRPHLVRLLPGHRLAPRIHVAKAFTTKRIAKTTVVR